MDGYGKCAGAIKGLWAEKVKHLQDREANGDFKIDYKTTPPSIPPGDVKKYEKYMEADKNSKAVEVKIMTLETAKGAIVKALAKFKSDATVKDLIHEISAGADWQRRAAAAEALGQIGHKDVPAALVEALKKDSEAAVRIAVVEAFRALKQATPEIVAALAAQLQSDFWQLKIGAAQALAPSTPRPRSSPYRGAPEGRRSPAGRAQRGPDRPCRRRQARRLFRLEGVAGLEPRGARQGHLRAEVGGRRRRFPAGTRRRASSGSRSSRRT